MKLKLTATLSIFCVGIMMAQEKKWTLRDCVEYALEHNISIKQSELDLQNADLAKADAKGNFLPTVNANASHSWNIGLNQNITTGLFENITTQYTSAGVNVGVDIYNGLQNVNRLRRANLSILANQYRLDNMKDDISLAVANAYLQILFNREFLNISKAQLSVTEQDLKRTKELVSSGVVPKGDLLEIEATAATQEQQKVNAENALRLAKISLAQLLLIQDYESFDVVDEDFMIPSTVILDYTPKTIYEKALTVRNDIKLSEANVALAETDIKISKGSLYPRLSAFYGYNTRASYQDVVSGAEQDPDNPNRQIGVVQETGQSVVTPNFRSIISGPNNIFEQFGDNGGHGFGVQLAIPVFNGFATRNNVLRSKVNLERSKLQLQQDKLNLENTINQAWNDAIATYKAYEASEKTLEARSEALKYAKERFNVGLMNSFNFSQAQSRVDNAAAELIRTKYDYIFRLKVLEFYFGLPISIN
ncbi:TolC family protein [Arenibacter sp. 6A1]|uniref:TolC family protein n=1 Tax=Arenibacter sp. 6A1 TaxID=2720391 RepID=UPI001445ED01|nr:TolC family protein [Arenibacter sp. 6A1]NKI25584.1 TolC family protein [Arenibacter sp. 6A1]